MSAPAASSSSSSSSSSSASHSLHSALAFFHSQPQSFPNLLASSDQSWYAQGHTQLAGAIGMKEDEFDELQPEKIPASAKGGWLLDAKAEQQEVEEFVAWVAASSALVREVVEVLPAIVHADCAVITSAELRDYSPKGRVDDEVFEKHRDVWERITRGCAVIKINVKDAAEPVWRWAVRANRKFTGHEDDATVAADAKLYCVPGVAESVVVSHKANGSVLHLAARDIHITPSLTTRWVFLGSKKVHVGAIWNGSTQDWAKKMALFKEARHEYVSEMVKYIEPHLQARGALILETLARFRLVVNAEYVSAIGTGPTDNERIYALQADAREAYGFMFTFNTLCPAAGCELGLDMMSGLRLLHKLGFTTVAAFHIPLSDLPRAKATVIPLEDIEGAVLYYSSKAGLVQLEKWKSSNYVVLRAVREKLKPFVYGRKGAEGKWPGLDAILQAMDAQKSASAVAVRRCSGKECQPQQAKPQKRNAKQRKKAAAQKRKEGEDPEEEGEEEGVAAAVEEMKVDSASASDDEERKSADAASSSPPVATLPDTYLVFSHPQLDTLGSVLQADCPGAQRVKEGEWRVACPVEAAEEQKLVSRVSTVFVHGTCRRPLDLALHKTIEKVQGRITSIDHIPISDEERQVWLSESEAFLRWLVVEVVENRRWPPKEVMNLYSKLWTLFREDQAKKAQQKQ
jgi:hypothetical protein